MSQQQDVSSSLLSLSIAASNAQPIHIPTSISTVNKHHRRLSSTGKTRRRLSDARDAANRPTSTAAAALSLASLSLSSSPPPVSHHTSTSLGSASNVLAHDLLTSPTLAHNLKPETVEHPSNASPKSPVMPAAKPIPIANGKNKKRGMDHKCETCSKIYRHPSCLIKHRWEHTPHWREASKYVLSKHQQVQLLEAAAILSHLSPSSNSLPDDRSLWPSFLSGGSLPLPENINFTSYSPTSLNHPHESSSYNSSYSPRQVNSVPTLGTNYYRTSSSYPNSGSSGPRLHDYPLPNSQGANGNVTQVRPGLVGVPNTKDSPSSTHSSTSAPTNSVLLKPIPTSSSNVPPLDEEEEISSLSQREHKPLSLPDQESFRSRSISIHSRSRSRSGSTSVSDDDEMLSFTDQEKSWRGFHGRGRYTKTEDLDEDSAWNGRYGGKTRERRKEGGHTRNPVEEEWDGMDMDMDMD